jgi:hypothetical protein
MSTVDSDGSFLVIAMSCFSRGVARAKPPGEWWLHMATRLLPAIGLLAEDLLHQGDAKNLEPENGNEVSDGGGATRSGTNAAQKGRRQGTSVSLDNRGPDRCWAARLDRCVERI